MEEEMKVHLIRLVSKNLGDAQDNLYRANLAFGKMSEEQLDKVYGHSDQTCRQIRDGYVAWYDEAKRVLEELAKE